MKMKGLMLNLGKMGKINGKYVLKQLYQEYPTTIAESRYLMPQISAVKDSSTFKCLGTY